MIENPLEYKNKLLLEHSTGRMRLDELNKECAYWFLETFDSFGKRAFPTPPQDYLDYKRLPYEKRQKVGNDFWLQKNIKEYLDIKEEIKNENASKLIQLKQMKGYIPEGDFVSHSKYNQKINELCEL